MNKERILSILNNSLAVIKSSYSKFSTYCNKQVFATSTMLVGLFILVLNLTLSSSLVMVYPFILGIFFLVLYFIYNRNHYFSFMGSHMLSLGLYIILLLTDLFPDGGDSAIVFFVGSGFLVFYALEGKWKDYWPLIPGITISLFGALLYLHTTNTVQMNFIVLIGKFWPLTIVLFGLISLFINPLKSICNQFIKKIQA